MGVTPGQPDQIMQHQLAMVHNPNRKYSFIVCVWVGVEGPFRRSLDTSDPVSSPISKFQAPVQSQINFLLNLIIMILILQMHLGKFPIYSRFN